MLDFQKSFGRNYFVARSMLNLTYKTNGLSPISSHWMHVQLRHFLRLRYEIQYRCHGCTRAILEHFINFIDPSKFNILLSSNL